MLQLNLVNPNHHKHRRNNLLHLQDICHQQRTEPDKPQCQDQQENHGAPLYFADYLMLCSYTWQYSIQMGSFILHYNMDCASRNRHDSIATDLLHLFHSWRIRSAHKV